MGPSSDQARSRLVWERSASALGADDTRIRKELLRLYPPSQFPFHIRVIGGKAMRKKIEFYIWDDRSINVYERISVFPERGDSGNVFKIAMAKVASLIHGLTHDPKPEARRE